MYRHLKKIVPLFLVLVLVLVPFAVYASEVTRLPEPPQDEESPNVFIYKSTSDFYRCVLFSNDTRLEFEPFDNDGDGVYDSGRIFFENYKRYTLVDGNWVFEKAAEEGQKQYILWKFSDLGVSSIDDAFKKLSTYLVYSDLSVFDTNSGIYFFYETSRNMSLSSGLSTQSITNLILTQIASLIPSLISLLVLVVGFYKAYRLLRQVLVGA